MSRPAENGAIRREEIGSNRAVQHPDLAHALEARLLLRSLVVDVREVFARVLVSVKDHPALAVDSVRDRHEWLVDVRNLEWPRRRMPSVVLNSRSISLSLEIRWSVAET